MGQRLVIDFQRNETSLATIYFHWGGYTKPSFEIIKDVYDRVLINADKMSDKEFQLAIIRYAEHSTNRGYVDNLDTFSEKKDEFIKRVLQDFNDGLITEFQMEYQCRWNEAHGGVSLSDQKFVQDMFPDEEFYFENVDRNVGIVAISKEGIRNHIGWAESLVTIDLSEKTIENGTFFTYVDDEYFERFDEDDNYAPNIENIEKIPLDPVSFSFSDINILCDVIIPNTSHFVRYGNVVYELIE